MPGELRWESITAKAKESIFPSSKHERSLGEFEKVVQFRHLAKLSRNFPAYYSLYNFCVHIKIRET